MVTNAVCVSGQLLPNNACSRLGVHAAFSAIFHGLKLVPAKVSYLVPL
jgi:hypothetical protein